MESVTQVRRTLVLQRAGSASAQLRSNSQLLRYLGWLQQAAWTSTKILRSFFQMGDCRIQESPFGTFLATPLGSQQQQKRRSALGEAFTTRPEEILRAPNDTEPGLSWRYCNVGFAIAARILEEISGETYKNRLSRTLFEAANLDRTSVGLPQVGPNSARPRTYRRRIWLRQSRTAPCSFWIRRHL